MRFVMFCRPVAGQCRRGRGGPIRRHLKLAVTERNPAEWNSLDVTVDGRTIRLSVDGKLVNKATSLLKWPGGIGLESERGIIQYRNIRLRPQN